MILGDVYVAGLGPYLENTGPDSMGKYEQFSPFLGGERKHLCMKA